MKHINECRKIYLSAFSDDGFFCDNLFEICTDDIVYIEEKGEAVSYLFLLPCEIEGERAKYIFAAATKKEMQGKGYMSRLLDEVKQKEQLLFLRPATKELIEFYKKAGFKEISATAKIETLPQLKPIDSFLSLSKKTEPDEVDEFPFMYYSKNNLEFKEIFFEYSMD